MLHIFKQYPIIS